MRDEEKTLKAAGCGPDPFIVHDGNTAEDQQFCSSSQSSSPLPSSSLPSSSLVHHPSSLSSALIPPPSSLTPYPSPLILDLALLAKPLDWTAVFERPGDVEIEVGVGSGFFLTRYAMENPGLNLLGIEVSPQEVFRAQDKCHRLGVTNARLLRCDAIYFLHDFPPDASVAAFHVYFSDPWPKNAHRKRRLWRREFVDSVARVLRPGGALFVKTDVTDYAKAIDKLLKGHAAFELIDEARLDLEPRADDCVTNFQRKALAKGHPIYYRKWRRV